MACRCSPCLLILRAEMDAHRPGWKYLGCCGDKAHAARKSDHNPYTGPGKSKGYAHAIDLGEGPKVPSMQWLVGKIMADPDRYPQVKYLIYERSIYYPRDGARKRGRYAYTGANAHDTHLHVSIHTTHTFDTRPWLIGSDAPEPEKPREDDMAKLIAYDDKNLSAFFVNGMGQLVTTYYIDGQGWTSKVLAEGAKVGAEVGVARDFQGTKGRLDLAVEAHNTADGKHLIHAFLVPGHEWTAERL